MTAGRIRFDGRDIGGLGGKARRALADDVQVVFQDPYGSLNPALTIGDILAEPLLTTGIGAKAADTRVRDMLDRVRLPSTSMDRYPSEFSGGQRQRIAIARALVRGPRLIVCDEPVSALDLTTQATILDLFIELQRDTGVAYLFVSHDLGVVRRVCHRVAVMYRGDRGDRGRRAGHPRAASPVRRAPATGLTRRRPGGAAGTPGAMARSAGGARCGGTVAPGRNTPHPGLGRKDAMPKIIDHDQRRRDIVEVAKSIILKGGFEAATMRSIAAEAGFANGALKHYFPGKESIVAATFETILQQMSEGVEAAGQKPVAADDALRGFLQATVPRDPEQIAAGRVLLALWEYAMANESLAELYRGHLGSWRSSLIARMEAARDEGSIRDQDYGPLADEYISAAVGATVINLMYPDGDRIADYENYIDRFLARLR